MDEKKSIFQEFTEYNEKNQWMYIYQKIRNESEEEASKCNFTTNESKKVNNRRLNRYRDVNPYDHSRIILKKQHIDSDYINASLVKLERAKRQYILCQGPLEHTVGHLWLMIWEQQSKAILMLNKIIEKKQVKCHLYWPKKEGDKLELPEVGLVVEFIMTENYKNFSKRLFRVTDVESTKSREVIQFHYTQWPDFGVPSSPIAFLQFLKQVRDSGVLDENVGPPVIHCSAGIGRSGTFCLVDCCLVLIDKECENRVNVREVLLELRKYRMGLIQTHDQLTFSYEAIIEGMRRMNNDTFNELDNLEIGGIASDDEETEQSPPPIPPRISSINSIERPSMHLPVNSINNGSADSSSDSSNSTSSDVPELDSSDPTDTDSDDSSGGGGGGGGVNKPRLSEFDANSTLPPVPIPNGTLDLTSPVDKQKFSSDEERSPLMSDNNVTKGNEVRHRNRAARQEALQEKIREIKRKQMEEEVKKINLPKKRRQATSAQDK